MKIVRPSEEDSLAAIVFDIDVVWRNREPSHAIRRTIKHIS
jgi:hypothetical protein